MRINHITIKLNRIISVRALRMKRAKANGFSRTAKIDVIMNRTWGGIRSNA
jgi:hypothetical protein